MDRKLVYPGAIPQDLDLLYAQRNAMVALGLLAQGALGTNTLVDGLALTPSIPASLAVNIGPGSIFTQANVDSVAFSTLGTDLSHSIIKQGINLDATVLTVVPPSTAGQAINYLVQAQLQEADTNAAVQPYYNAANPAVPFSGPAGSGISQPTQRKATVLLQLKAGAAATAGTQVTPAPDSGFVGLYVITVAQGATAPKASMS